MVWGGVFVYCQGPCSCVCCEVLVRWFLRAPSSVFAIVLSCFVGGPLVWVPSYSSPFPFCRQVDLFFFLSFFFLFFVFLIFLFLFFFFFFEAALSEITAAYWAQLVRWRSFPLGGSVGCRDRARQRHGLERGRRRCR